MQIDTLQFANESDKRNGWTLSPTFLSDLYEKLDGYSDQPSWEGIELVLLAFHGLPLPVKEDTDHADRG